MPQGTVHQSVWLDKVHAGADFIGYAEGRPGMECHPPSLFQSNRRAPERHDGREPQWNPEQSDAIYHAGRSGQA